MHPEKPVERAVGLDAADAWLKLEPENAHALSHRAQLIFSIASLLEALGNHKLGKAMHTEALTVRRQLLGNPQVDQFTAGKSITNLADSLDVMKQFEESLKLRERVFNLYVEHKLPTFAPLDNWSWTCQKAGEATHDYEKKKELLIKAGDLAEQAIFQRPGSRTVLARAAKIAKDLGELEYNHGKLAEKAKKMDEAERHYDEAYRHFERLATLSKRLATAPDLVERMRDYSRSFYSLGLIERERGRLDEARANFKICLHIREQSLRDYKGNLFEVNMQYDLLFALVAVGDHAQAFTLANEKLGKDGTGFARVGSHNLYRLACIYSLCIPAVDEARRPMKLTPEDKQLQDVYRTKALSCLDNAYEQGYTYFSYTRIDADLAPIRDDPRFEKIQLKYEKK